MHVYLMQQRENCLTWRGISISAWNAKEFHIHPAMYLAIPVVRVSRHGILSAGQDLLSFGEIFGTWETDLRRRLKWLRIACEWIQCQGKNLHSTMVILLTIYIGASQCIDLRKKHLFSILQITCTKATLMWGAVFTRILPHFGTCRVLVCCIGTMKGEDRSTPPLFLSSEKQGLCLQAILLLFHRHVNF